MSRNRKIAIIAAAVAAAIVIIIAIASCSPRSHREPPPAAAAASGSSFGYSSCMPPMACGPHYAGYVPAYYLIHPSMVYLSPYSSYYAPTIKGRSYNAVRTPTGRAPVTPRTPMAYPPGYKPVPGDFQPPTAPPVPSLAPTAAPAPSRAPSVPTAAPAAPKETAKAPAGAPEPAKKATPAKKAPSAPKSAPRSKAGRR